MARAGGGSRGGGMRSSAGRSISRSSGGHRVGSGSRAGSSYSRPSIYSRPSSSSRPSSGGYRPSNPAYPSYKPSTPRPSTPPRPPVRPTPPPPRRTYGYGGYSRPIVNNTTVCTGSDNGNPTVTTMYGREEHRRDKRLGWMIAIVVICLVMAMIFAIWAAASKNSTIVNREKLELGIGFNNECVIDEINWFDNPVNTSRNLQVFFEKTGVQPFIVLKDYDASLTTDEAKEAYANQWYEDNIDNEATFLYMYFAEEDVDNDVGYMVYVSGLEIGPVMDAEAIDVFWSYLDSMWYSDMSTDELFVSTFNKTATRIMDKTTTPADVGKYAVIFFGIACILGLMIIVMEVKRKHEREKNAETERILNTPLGKSSIDYLADKYTNNN